MCTSIHENNDIHDKRHVTDERVLVSLPDFHSQSVPKLGGTGLSTVQGWIWNRHWND